MDSVNNSLRLAQQYHENTSVNCGSSNSSLSTDVEYNNRESNSNKQQQQHSSYFRRYEYQIVEMQHEHELLLEDKVYII